jgi:predicted nucleotidyltransferase
MLAELAEKRDALAALCRRYDVARLEVFGSAARRDDFDPSRSDYDFLVEFKRGSRLPALQQFFGLAEDLKGLLGRPVDLIEFDAVKNPFVRQDIIASRQVVYAA